MTERNIWLDTHYESGQVPMKDIRGVFAEMGYDLVPGEHPDAYVNWLRLEAAYERTFQSASDQKAWEAFRAAVDRLGYRPARMGGEGQEDATEGFGEQAVATVPRAEARERIVGQTLGKLRWLSVNEGVAMPPVHPGDVGVDLQTTFNTEVEPGGVTYAPLGVHFAAPPGAWILLIGRSSLASKLGLGMVPGVIDNGFRGEMLAGLFTLGRQMVYVPAGTRVAQAILIPMFPTLLEQVEELPPSARGENGFGSTGGH